MSRRSRRSQKIRSFKQKAIKQWDVSGLLKLMWETWNDVFGRYGLGRAERSIWCREVRRLSQ